jgi:plasmid stabilization system protein ParE
MPGRIRVSLAASAVEGLEELRVHHREQQVPEVAERLLTEILGRIEDLTDHPDMGHIVPEFGRENLRELIHPPFRIVYRRDRAKVRIVRVWRSERLLKLPA